MKTMKKAVAHPEMTRLSAGTAHPRPCSGSHDLARMKALVSAARLTRPHSGYPHIGDLDWWLFYGSRSANWPDIVFLWEDADGTLLGWLILDLTHNQFDSATLPALMGSPLEEIMLRWAENDLIRRGAQETATFAWADEPARITMLEERGYSGADDLTYFAQPLDAELPVPQLPEGFRFLDRLLPEYVAQRAEVHFDAFQPSRMTTGAYRHFMTAPSYDPSLDVVVLAPDGSFAAFAMAWIDPNTKLGLFEPVGTRTAMQRRGLGQAALFEGMRRMRARGMNWATVCADARAPDNQAFYRAAGFQPMNTIRRYARPFPMNTE